MSTEKPNWKKGDVVCLLASRCEPERVMHVAVATENPYWSDRQGLWLYGIRDCREFRLATVADIEEKLQWAREDVKREQARVERLQAMLHQVSSREAGLASENKPATNTGSTSGINGHKQQPGDEITDEQWAWRPEMKSAGSLPPIQDSGPIYPGM